MSCPDCFRGGISSDEATGKWATTHGLRTYIAEPEAGITPKGIIVYITDAFGPDFLNNRVLCDKYAKGGFLVYCPDLMNGRALPPAVIPSTHTLLEKQPWLTTLFIKPLLFIHVLYHIVPWMLTCSIAKTQSGVIKYFQALRTTAPPFDTKDLKVGAAGFCWGGKHVVTLAQDEPAHRVVRHASQTCEERSERLIDAAFTAHPTFVRVPNDVEKIKIPISWAVGEEDLQMKAADIWQVKKILEGKEGHEVRILKGAKHGFANRTNPEDVVAMEAATRAEGQAVGWFGRWFA